MLKRDHHRILQAIWNAKNLAEGNDLAPSLNQKQLLQEAVLELSNAVDQMATDKVPQHLRDLSDFEEGPQEPPKNTIKNLIETFNHNHMTDDQGLPDLPELSADLGPLERLSEENMERAKAILRRVEHHAKLRRNLEKTAKPFGDLIKTDIQIPPHKAKTKKEKEKSNAERFDLAGKVIKSVKDSK